MNADAAEDFADNPTAFAGSPNNIEKMRPRPDKLGLWSLILPISTGIENEYHQTTRGEAYHKA